MGMGGRVAGGLATGLAVGAGMMAAQAIGKTLTGNDERGGEQLDASGNAGTPLPGNSDLGGQDFGITDNSSWDDGGGVADAGGGWDT